MRFSFWPNSGQPWSEVLTLAQHVEATGWDGVYFCDHFMPNLGADASGPWGEVWTTLSALAMAVPRVRLGTMVLGNTYRHPAVVAKMAATLDQISGGRMVLGMGAGWQENEHRAYGIPFYTMGERLARLEEACAVIRSLFSQPRTTFNGKYYQLEDAPLEPKPIQRPLPILVGGGGERVTLRLTARYADAWNVWGDPSVLRHKMAILDRHCREVGRSPQAIERTAVALLVLSDDKAVLERARATATARPSIVGTPEELRAIIAGYKEAGVHELIIPDFNLGPLERKRATLDRFIREVAPAAR